MEFKDKEVKIMIERQDRRFKVENKLITTIMRHSIRLTSYQLISVVSMVFISLLLLNMGLYTYLVAYLIVGITTHRVIDRKINRDLNKLRRFIDENNK